MVAIGPSPIASTSARIASSLLLDLVTVIAALWVFVIHLAMLAEVLRFSVDRTFALFLLNLLACIVFVGLLGFIK